MTTEFLIFVVGFIIGGLVAGLAFSYIHRHTAETSLLMMQGLTTQQNLLYQSYLNALGFKSEMAAMSLTVDPDEDDDYDDDEDNDEPKRY